MKFVDIGGLRLSAIGLGTWQFGSGEWGYGTSYANDTAPNIVNRSLDLGVNLIDTAEAYGFGRSEQIVGRAMANRRSEAVIATKLFPILPFDPIVDHRIKGSLRRLDTDVIDLYQVHWSNPVVPNKATMAALAKAQADGLITNVGISNFSLAKWQEAEANLGGPVLTNQVRYSLIDRRPEFDVLPWAQANDRIVIAYSPLSQGLLSGRYDADHLPSGMRASTAGFLPENMANVSPLIAVLRDVADGHGATCSQIALAWLMRRPNVVVIPGASSVEQAEANAAAADIELSDDENDALTGASDALDLISGRSAFSAVAKLKAERAVERVRRTIEGLQS